MLQKFKFGVLLVLLFFAVIATSSGQSQSPVSWYFRVEPVTDNEVMLVATATLAPGWHIYSQFMEAGGPQPTQFLFENSTAYTLVGKPEEKSEIHRFYDSTFMMEVIWLSKVAVFTQKIKLHQPNATITGKVCFMACTRDRCLLPEECAFTIAASRPKP